VGYFQDLVQQQAQVAAYVVQILHTVANFAFVLDVNIRLKSPFNQCMRWDSFVRDHKDRPLFRRHLRMAYESFGILLECIREHVKVDTQMGF
jgi:hypothetical protein